MKKIALLTAAALVTPFVAAAQTIEASYLADMLGLVNGFINTVVPIIISLAVLVFLWGVFRYISSGDDEESRKGARQLMINGVIAIFVMVSLWGLVNMLDRFFGLEDTAQAAPSIAAYNALTIF